MRAPSSCQTLDRCRIRSAGPMTSTCMGWERVYDGHGNLLTKDPNVIHIPMRCDTCGRRWDAGAANPLPDHKEPT